MIDSGPASSRWVRWAAWAIIILAAGYVRLEFMTQPIRYDEATTFLRLQGRSLLAALEYYTPNNHLLHTLLVWCSVHLFGSAEWAVRLPACLAGLALVPSAGYIFSRLGGPTVGLLTAGLVAGSNWLIFYSTNARGYSQTVLFLLWAFHYFMKAVEKVEENDARTFSSRPAWWSGLFVGLALATVPSMAWPAAGLGLGLVLAPGSAARRWSRAWPYGLAAGTIGAVLYLPFIRLAGLAPITANSHVASIPLAKVVSMLGYQILELSADFWPAFGLDWPSLILTLVALAVGLIRRREGLDRWLVFMIAWPIAMELIQSVRAPARTFLYLAPLFYAAWSRAAVKVGLDRIDYKGLLVPLLTVCLALAPAWAVLNSGRIKFRTETGLSRAASTAVEKMRGLKLTDRDRVVAEVPDDKPVAYYLHRSGATAGVILSRRRSHDGRVFIIETPENLMPELERNWPFLADRPRKLVFNNGSLKLWISE